ncbi:MAG: RepB family DNA primase [Gammaproteobacteria bacterium]|nr:RepB family DNA primase [Gammaproteobacteria bacterium]
MSLKLEKEIDPSTLKVPKSAPPLEAVNDSDRQDGNQEFIAAIFNNTPEGAYAAICTKPENPEVGGWSAQRVGDAFKELSAKQNNYLNCSSFRQTDNVPFNVKKEQFFAYYFILLDDLGTKVSLSRLNEFELSWLIETSPDNYQGGIILDRPITSYDEANQLIQAVIEAGLCDSGSSGVSRWARLPVGINGKPKYNKLGKPFECKLIKWGPDKRYTPQEIISRLELKLVSTNKEKTSTKSVANNTDDVFTPGLEKNQVISKLIERGLYKKQLDSIRHDITCPWLNEHTDELDNGTAYFEPSEYSPLGGFCCHHSHREKYHIRELLDYLDVQDVAAQNKPVIRIVSGDLHRVIDAAEKELANSGKHYQSGGLIVSIAIDSVTGDPSIVPSSIPALTKELSIAATWLKHDGRSKEWVPCDPPQRHIAILNDAQKYQYLPVLKGVVRQPYFLEQTGVLITQMGYNETSQLFGVFDPKKFEMPEPTKEVAQDALTLLRGLLAEFHFVSDEDEAAALSAIFTAVVRSILPYAPAFHVKAPVSGSGKTYLCELIGAFAGPAGNQKVSYPASSEEATKVVLALLLTSPAAIEFDDMDTDWKPHGIIKRMLTAEQVTDRILGLSKSATVSTRTLFLGSGNNVGPVRDLLRRVLTININPRCTTPAVISYKDSPVDKVRKQRGEYVCAVLTIMQAWKEAGSPRVDVESIATYSGAWSDYCRYPLIWLGFVDPAKNLLEQIKHDPDEEVLKELLVEWNHVFGSIPTTVRKVIKKIAAEEYKSTDKSDFCNALYELPVFDKGEINPSKLGWFLKKNANRVINGYEFQKCEADGRTAWRVVYVKSSDIPLPAKQKKNDDLT